MGGITTAILPRQKKAGYSYHASSSSSGSSGSSGSGSSGGGGIHNGGTAASNHNFQYSSIELEGGAAVNSNNNAVVAGDYGNNNAAAAAAATTATTVQLRRHLSLVDLVAIGVGVTVGSGLFMAAGLIAAEYAGPAAVVSWLLAGAAAAVSGCCYAELSARIPVAGSVYAYAFVAAGELPAVWAAACLSIEYMGAAAAVSRSWGDKCVAWMSERMLRNTAAAAGDALADNEQQEEQLHWILQVLQPQNSSVRPLAFLISAGSVVLLLHGVKESKRVTNAVTAVKLTVVAFMIVAGMWYCRPANWTPFVPAQFGVTGMFRGATACFLGYGGYDCICCMAGEVVNPRRTLPAALLCTIAVVSAAYMLATAALTGMQPYAEISTVSGFPAAFLSVRAVAAAELTAAGEVVTLPVIVLITTMSQPRLQYAMAVDGLLPAWFARQDEDGNLRAGTVAAGCVIVAVATAVPFSHVNDMVSFAILSALSLTDTSVILLWHEERDHPESKLPLQLMLAFHGAAAVLAVTVSHFMNWTAGRIMAVAAAAAACWSIRQLLKSCPRSDVFGGHRQHYHEIELRPGDEGYFETPAVPYLPCAGILFNWYLIAQLDLVSIAALLGVLLLATVYYYCYLAGQTQSRRQVGTGIGGGSSNSGNSKRRQQQHRQQQQQLISTSATTATATATTGVTAATEGERTGLLQVTAEQP